MAAQTLSPLTYTVEEAGALLGISRWAAYEAVKNGTFPAPVIRIGRRLVIPRKALADLLRLPENQMPESGLEETK